MGRRSTLVVLVPGFLGHGDGPVLGSYFPGLKEALEAQGFDAVTLTPPPVASSEARGVWLAGAITQARGQAAAARVIVIAHSQAGVDARAALDAGAPVDAVASLSAPHEGTDVADVALAWPQGLVRQALAEAARASLALQHLPVTPAAPDDALVSLSREGMRKFQARHPSSPVPFFSVAAFSGADIDDACTGGAWSRPRRTDAIHPTLLFGQAMIRSSRGVSDDGVVPTRSMRFGTFLGCVAADHHDWLGWSSEDAFDQNAFVTELARGLDDVARSDAAAMDAHIVTLARLARARPL